MPLFVVEYFDKPGSGETRTANRDAHIAYRQGLGPALVLAGPLFEDFDGNAAIGSLVIIEAKDKAEAAEIAHRDPYVTAGAFETVRLYAHRMLVLKPPAKLPA